MIRAGGRTNRAYFPPAGLAIDTGAGQVPVSRVGTLEFMAPGARRARARQDPSPDDASAQALSHRRPPRHLTPPRSRAHVTAEIARLTRRPVEEKEWLRSHGVALYGAQVDIWSVGVTAFELIYGSTPFSGGETEADVLRLIVEEQPVFLPTFTRALRRVSSGALEFLSVRAHALERLMGGSRVPARGAGGARVGEADLAAGGGFERAG